MNYNPDRSLWLPSRRKFFFLGLAAGVATFLPDVPILAEPFEPQVRLTLHRKLTIEWPGGRTQTYSFVGNEPEFDPTLGNSVVMESELRDRIACKVVRAEMEWR